MAVPGRKLSDISGSISSGSVKDFDHSCDPCLTAGQHIAAYGYCSDCKEYQCQNCFMNHKDTEAWKNHQLDRAYTDKQGILNTHSEICTEKCHLHKDEVITFCCQQHEELDCPDCRNLNHMPCNHDYKPTNSADAEDSYEYKRTTWLLNQKMKEVNAVVKKATKRGEEIDVCNEGLITEIDKFQKEINDRIHQIRKEIQAKVEKKKFSDKQVVQGVLATCTVISADICELQSSLKVNKTTKQNRQLDVTIKQAMSKLKSYEIKKSEEKIEKTNIQYKFEHDQDLQKVLFKHNAFGKLSLSTTLANPRKKLGTLIHKEEINIQVESDNSSCCIFGSAVLSPNKLVLADANNKKLKVLDTQSKLVVEEKEFDSYPLDIATLPQDKIAVTLPQMKQIFILASGSKLSVVKTIPVEGQCRGVTYSQDHLYVVCKQPTNVVILDTTGEVQNKISLNTDIFKDPFYIVVGEDSRLIYISNPDGGCIVSITLQGEISAVYTNLPGPWGMLILDDGSLLVCCCGNDTIHHISGDLKQGQAVTSGLQDPQSICYNHQQCDIYVGGYECGQLNVLNVK